MDLIKTVKEERNATLMLVWRLMMVFLLFSVQRLLFFLFNLSYFPQMPKGHLGELMISGLKFDLSAILYVNSLYLLLMLLPIRLKYNHQYKRYTRILFLVTNSIALAANFVDVVYFRYILRRIDFSFFTEFKKRVSNLEAGACRIITILVSGTDLYRNDFVSPTDLFRP